MILRNIRARMLAAALVPVSLVVFVIVSVFWFTGQEDLGLNHRQRATMLAQQLAMASEYGVFADNRSSLQLVADSILAQEDVHSVSILAADGQVLVQAGPVSSGVVEGWGDAGFVAQLQARGVDVFSQPIRLQRIALDDVFLSQVQGGAPEGLLLGHAVVEVSREGLLAREQQMMRLALLVGFVGLLVGGFLGLRLGEDVVAPITGLTREIERIGAGDLRPADPPRADDPLRDVHASLGEMAQRLRFGRDELERQVAHVTQALRRKKEEAEEATLAKSRFLASASHDLRQPLHALGMFVARLGQLPQAEQSLALVAHIEASVQSLQDLLDGLLDLSRLESGAVQPQMGPVDLGDVLRGVRAVLEPLALEKGLRLRVRPTALWGVSDSPMLQRIVLNLAHNAVRYTERGTVLVSVRRVQKGQAVRIDVADSGIGIAPEYQEAVFKEFYQVGNVARARAHGMGLGLSIVKRSAQLLGHGLALRSHPGCGTCVSLVLPWTAAASVPQSAAVVDVVDESTGGRILLVEDDAQVRAAVQLLLQSWGYVVQVAEGLEAARDCVAAGFVPEVLLCDYRLGERANGVETIAALRAQLGKDVPACLMSGDTDAALMHVASHAHLPLLHKPVRPAKLRSVVRRLLIPL